MKTRVWLWLFPLLLLLAAGAWHLRQAEPASKPAPREINIRAETVRQSLAEPSIKLVSKLAANRSVAISPEVTGRIATIAVSSGQQVTQGQTLIALDAGKQQAELAEQSASVRDEVRKLRDMRKLVARGAVTTSELEGQEATVAQAQARVDAARYELSLRTLAAPFDGTVSLIDLSEGALVNSGDVLLHLDELAKLRLDLAVPERYLSLLRPGMAVTATSSAWPDQSFSGVLETLDSRISSDTQNIKARVILPNTGGQLRPGMLMNVDLSATPEDDPDPRPVGGVCRRAALRLSPGGGRTGEARAGGAWRHPWRGRLGAQGAQRRRSHRGGGAGQSARRRPGT